MPEASLEPPNNGLRLRVAFDYSATGVQFTKVQKDLSALSALLTICYLPNSDEYNELEKPVDRNRRVHGLHAPQSLNAGMSTGTIGGEFLVNEEIEGADLPALEAWTFQYGRIKRRFSSDVLVTQMSMGSPLMVELMSVAQLASEFSVAAAALIALSTKVSKARTTINRDGLERTAYQMLREQQQADARSGIVVDAWDTLDRLHSLGTRPRMIAQDANRSASVLSKIRSAVLNKH